MSEQHTRPGDLIGRDTSSGQVRIDRVLPLPWLLGVLFTGVITACAQFYSLAQLREVVTELRQEVRAMRAEVNVQNNLTAIHTYQITNLEQRLSQLESRRQP